MIRYRRSHRGATTSTPPPQPPLPLHLPLEADIFEKRLYE